MPFVYLTIIPSQLSSDQFNRFLEFAPAPAVLRGFLHRKVWLFVSKSGFDEGLQIYAHRDQGSGPLVFGAGTPGASTTGALMPPTCRSDDAKQKRILTTAFEPHRDPVDNVHYVTLSQRGAFVSIPSQYWHSFVSYGMRICVSYFDRTLDKE